MGVLDCKVLLSLLKFWSGSIRLRPLHVQLIHSNTWTLCNVIADWPVQICKETHNIVAQQFLWSGAKNRQIIQANAIYVKRRCCVTMFCCMSGCTFRGCYCGCCCYCLSERLDILLYVCASFASSIIGKWCSNWRVKWRFHLFNCMYRLHGRGKYK